jgi:hypothetical protein
VIFLLNDQFLLKYLTIPLIVFVFIHSIDLSGQVQDQFIDSDLTSNPKWVGNLDHFMVKNGFLHLSAARAGSSKLFSLIKPGSDSLVWEIDFTLLFNPSISNQLSLVLLTDSLASALTEGYVISIGENGSNDALVFKKIENSIASTLSRGLDSRWANAVEGASIKIILTDHKNWSILSKLPNQTWLEEIKIESQINPIPDFQYSGILCKYTSTRKDKFSFGKIIAGEPILDSLPPILLSHSVNQGSISLTFNEELGPSSLNKDLFNLEPAIQIQSVEFGLDNKTLLLKPAIPFKNGQLYTLTMTNIVDNAENPLSHEFQFQVLLSEEAAYGDLIFSEMMIDPSPSQGLPNSEYIEVFNPSQKIFNLSNFIWENNGNQNIFPDFWIKPNEYVFFVQLKNFNLFQNVERAISTDDWSALRNSNGFIKLLSIEGDLIYEIGYDLNTYGNSSKKDGGWSLEIINPRVPCLGKINWKASISSSGGTPGKENSLFGSAVSPSAPAISGVNVISLIVNYLN